MTLTSSIFGSGSGRNPNLSVFPPICLQVGVGANYKNKPRLNQKKCNFVLILAKNVPSTLHQ